MSKKYYTPEIEEFHVGFEYEILQKSEWVKDTYMCNSKVGVTFDDMPELAKLSRVKHLDREDIESLVKEINPFFTYRRDDEHYTAWELSDFKEIWIANTEPTWVWITHINANNGERNNVPFKIKNKSELKKVLKMIGL